MELNHLPCLLLCAAALTACGVLCEDEGDEAYRWTRQSIPLLLDTRTEPLNPPLFTGQEEPEHTSGSKVARGTERQSSRLHALGYETMYENGTRLRTDVTLQGFNGTSGEPRSSSSSGSLSRRKRQVYGADGRFVISDSHFSTNYPFSTAVRLSMGCSGVLVSPKHVLTAAHCLHDGRDYLGGAKGLRVGVLQLKKKRRRGGGGGGGGGRRRAGRRRGGAKDKEQEGEEKGIGSGEEQNSVDGAVGRGSWGGSGRGRGRGRRKDGMEVVDDQGNVHELEGRKQRGPNRVRRSTEEPKQPVFRWTRVKQTRIPQGWIQTGNSNNSSTSDYDYALLELKRPLKQKHMELGVVPSSARLARIHFSGYDADKSLPDSRGEERVVYRFCSVAGESEDLLYQHCDAEPGASGAGVYVRLRRDVVGDNKGGKGKWQRRVIGVFSGHKWVEVDGGEQRDFNVAVRITPAKYAQICHWIHGDPSLCKEV